MTKTALVVGGSGMLSGLVRSLAEDFDTVGVVARDHTKLKKLAGFSPNIVIIQADYSDLVSFEKSFDQFTSDYERPSLVASWIHSTAPEAPYTLAKYSTGEFYDITGSSGREADHPSREHEEKLTKIGLNYHRVILGSINGRWLTNEEISDGVLLAIQLSAHEFTVGT